MSKLTTALLTIGSLAATGAAVAQPPPLTLTQAVKLSVEHYPAVRAAAEQSTAAAEDVSAARTAYLPRLDVLAQFNRATRNNVFGMVLPQSVIPSISGPVLAERDGTSVWGSAVGVLVTWEVLDFGIRGSNVSAAEAAGQRADASAARTRLDVSATAADAFLTLVAAEETVRAARAAVDRAKEVERVAGALVGSELRPGGDLERARAETALAGAQLVEADRAAAHARASLAGLTGVPAAALTVQAGVLLDLPPGPDPESAVPEGHPAARELDAARREAQARGTALGRAWLPRIDLQGAAFARGTGAMTDGTTSGGASGLGPDVSNWGVGLTITFPLLAAPAAHAKREAERHQELADGARYAQVVDDLATRLEQARASLAAARALVPLVDVRLDAARKAERQAVARYTSGLSAIVEVADAERLLAQAEVDDALAILNVWRARLSWGHASGDIGAFLQDAGR